MCRREGQGESRLLRSHFQCGFYGDGAAEHRMWSGEFVKHSKRMRNRPRGCRGREIESNRQVRMCRSEGFLFLIVLPDERA